MERRSTIESMEVRNRKNDAGKWIIDILHCHDWVSMHPSRKGAFRVSARDALDLTKHWKGRILAFRQRQTGSQYVNEALVQHVFLHKDIRVHPEVQMQRHMPNTVYPSDSIEWQSIECFTGILQVVHDEIGKLIYEGKSPRQLVGKAIFFYNSKYIVPKGSNDYGTLEPLSLPNLNSREWPTCSSSILHTYTHKISMDILNAMKPITGSRNVHLNWFIPIAIFGHIFKSCVGLHRTRCTCIMKSPSDDWLCRTLGKDWSSKTSSELETIECRASSKDVVFRYFIGRQTLCLVFKYRRWRMLNGEWNSIDQDSRGSASMELSLIFDGCEPLTLQIEDDWPLSNIRQEITISIPNPPVNFFFQLDGRKIRSRNENSIVSGQCLPPHILKVVESS